VSTDRVASLQDRIRRILDQDTRLVVAINAAIRRMAELGLSAEDVRALLKNNPSEGKVIAGDKEWHGFASREQAGYAALAGLAKKEWPAGLQAVHERVTALIRSQEPERAGDGESAIVVMPVVVLEQPEVKRFKRLRSGKIKEIGAVEEDDVIEATAVSLPPAEVEAK